MFLVATPLEYQRCKAGRLAPIPLKKLNEKTDVLICIGTSVLFFDPRLRFGFVVSRSTQVDQPARAAISCNRSLELLEQQRCNRHMLVQLLLNRNRLVC